MNKGYNKVTVTKEYLIDQYINNKESCSTIARNLGVSDWWVITRLRKYGVSTNRASGKFLIDITGKRFGHYTTIKRITSKGQMTYWLCRCDCGRYSEVASPQLRKGIAKSCGKCENSVHWKGEGEMSGQYFCVIKGGAKRRKIIFNIKKDYIWKLFLEQNKKCVITGLPLVFVHSYGNDSRLQTASLDRIDSTKGYEVGNVRWVHKTVNIMRWNMSDEQLYKWSKLIVNGPLSKQFKSN